MAKCQFAMHTGPYVGTQKHCCVHIFTQNNEIKTMKLSAEKRKEEEVVAAAAASTAALI